MRRLYKAIAPLTLMQRANWMLILGCAIAALNLMFTLFFYQPEKHFKVNHHAMRDSKTTEQPVIQLSELTKRNAFEPLWKAPPPPRRVVVQQPVAPPVPKIPLSQKVSRYRLVGILHEGAPQAVLEDQQTQKTLYLKAGQTLEDIEVEKVQDDHVTLKSADERMDLTL